MANATRAKFRVTGSHVAKLAKQGGQVDVLRVQMTVVHGGSAENDKFFAATPSGSIELSLVNAEAGFAVGQELYVDFTPVVVSGQQSPPAAAPPAK